ncbi:response regulator [Aquimarina sp. 2-A2]|uniref:response regulator n=1 Tax=Aquimarina sp. 2-A2 TaxID=3382644 RepID=UPI00387F25F7
MKNTLLTVLIIDDHPLISEAYKRAFEVISSESSDISFSISVANNCEAADAKIKEIATNNKKLDIVFLDIKLPPSQDGRILSGEDIGIKINKLLPETKVIVSTTFNDNYRIHSIFRNLNPDGFLIKNDITPIELVTTIKNIISDPPYYSKTVVKLLRKEVSNEFLLDNIDRKLLYELSIGAKMKDLPKILPLSIAGIEKRKRHLKQIFNVKSVDDKELLLKAREMGFI